jgi:hypothetical protein
VQIAIALSHKVHLQAGQPYFSSICQLAFEPISHLNNCNGSAVLLGDGDTRLHREKIASLTLVLLVTLPLPSPSQVRVRTGIGGTQIIGSDLAVLEAKEKRDDLLCRVKPEKPFVGFDLRFHATYTVELPLSELSGSQNLLSILFRVAPASRPNDAVYFTQRVRVPFVEEDAKGDAVLQGGFDIGEGKYIVDWLMRDQGERVCSDNWEVEAALPSRDRDIELSLKSDAIEAVPPTEFSAEPTLARAAEPGQLRIKVLMNFAPQKTLAAALRPIDTSALVGMLRTLGRDARIAALSLVAFNLNEEKILFRQEKGTAIDFPALGASLDSLNLGTIDLNRLIDKGSDTRFLDHLIQEEVAGAQDVDAVVFAGPKAMLDEKVPEDILKEIRNDTVPVFYLNYALNPMATPWRDTIGQAVRVMKGVEYTVSRPRDLWFAVSEMVNRVVKSRNQKTAAAVSLQ